MAKLTPTMLNLAMLRKVQNHAAQIMFLSMDAMRMKYGKKQDKIVQEIMEHNDAIEELYSTNWH